MKIELTDELMELYNNIKPLSFEDLIPKMHGDYIVYGWDIPKNRKWGDTDINLYCYKMCELDFKIMYNPEFNEYGQNKGPLAHINKMIKCMREIKREFDENNTNKEEYR